MPSSDSDDEVEKLPEVVSHYYFEDAGQEPVSFSILPISWNNNPPSSDVSDKQEIYVRGTTDDGLHTIYKPVRAWKFDISGEKPEISVLLSKDSSNWVKLQKPRLSYEEYIRTVLITVNFLHVVKRYPDLLGKGVWEKLSRIFRLLEETPSPKHVMQHKALIERAVEHNESLAKSKYFMSFLQKNPQKKNRADENVSVKGKSEFIVDDDDFANDDLVEDGSDDEEGGSGDEEDGSGGEEDGSGDEEDAFDSVCCICDEGGSILCCEGSCMRSFHATPRAAKKAMSQCVSLGFTEKEVADLQIFICQNCQYKRHQCYSCGQLGSSDKQSGAEVFQCVNATCGYFYHPRCVAEHLHSDNKDAARELGEKIVAGESFTCPLHVCCVCKQPEDKSEKESRLAVCRRCPTAYHQKCLPREIAFEDDDDKGIVQRAWDDLLPGRILIYCLKHDIIERLGTPRRNHIKFPAGEKKEKEYSTLPLNRDKVVPKAKKSFVGAPSSAVRHALKPKKEIFPENQPDKTIRRISKVKGTVTSRKFSTEKISSIKVEQQCLEQSDLVKPVKTDELDEFGSTKTTKIALNSVPELDSDSEARVLELMKEASSMITLDDIIGKHEKQISSRAYKQRMDPCKSITQGKVEGSCKAVREATIKLDGGGSIEDAKAICEPQVLNQMVKWKGKLRVYLAPFLYGMRYTSFGRHFTKIDKLQEIVDQIHWYVNSTDTIVDFCCGANDFSLLMKQRLEETGKSCSYKNYDLFRPKNDFSFEKKDWMTVQPKDLPTGSQLIMGLNPPFGVKARLANQFINKALEFKPKLLILIVPQETERLDKKKTPYDLVWEDRDRLSGKSFYLPGSVDVNDKQMEDWNIVAPVLYLWSRPDWTARHKAIAKKHGHLHGGGEGNNTDKPGRDPSAKKHEHAVVSEVDIAPLPDDAEELKDRGAGGMNDLKKGSAGKDHTREKHVNAAHNSRANKNSRRKRRTQEMHVREAGESSREYKRHRSSPVNPHHGWPHHSPVHSKDGRISSPLRYQRSPANVEIRNHGPDNFVEPASHGDRRFSLERQPFTYQKSPSNVEIRDPQGQFETTGNVGRSYREGDFGIPGSYYDDRTRNYNPQTDIYPSGRDTWSVGIGARTDYSPRVSHPLPDYPPRISGEWASGYIRGPEGYGVNHPYSEPEERYRRPAYPTESAFGSMATMSAMDKYNPRLDELNPVRMSGYTTHLGRPVEAGMYNHLAPRQGYPGVPMGFATGPLESTQHHHSSSGGWIND